jgi:hypothetical protein
MVAENTRLRITPEGGLPMVPGMSLEVMLLSNKVSLPFYLILDRSLQESYARALGIPFWK